MKISYLEDIVFALGKLFQQARRSRKNPIRKYIASV